MLNPFTQISGMIRSVDNEIKQLQTVVDETGNGKFVPKLKFLRNNRKALEECLKTYMNGADFTFPIR